MKLVRILVFILGISLFQATVSCDISKEEKKAVKTENINKIRSGKLQDYAFRREAYDRNDMTLLLGNSEMGGRARLDGLGFDRLWFADFWRTNAARMPLFGPKFSINKSPKDYISYSQSLALNNALLRTEVTHPDASYTSEIFFSNSNHDLLIIRLSNLKGKARADLTLHLPVFDVDGNKGDRWDVRKSERDRVFIVEQKRPNLVIGQSIDSAMTRPGLMFGNGEHATVVNKMVYGAWCSVPLEPTHEAGNFTVKVQEESEITLIFSESTNWSGGLLENNVLNAIGGTKNFKHLLNAHNDAWRQDWGKMAVIDVPDQRHEQLWYRSLFWLLCTCSSEKFLPGECQFGHEGWNMIPFTYGTAGWGVHAFTMLGYPEKALNMLNWHYKPEALHRNALHWLRFAEQERKTSKMTALAPYPQDVNSPEARLFAHEIRTTGDGTLLTWGNQAHLTGFSLELFQRYYNYYPTQEMLYSRLYPIAKGAAEFWSNFLIWDDKNEEYYTPKTWGSSEGGMQNSPLDAVMAAKKCLRAASKYARQVGEDEQLVEKWEFIERNIHYPENDSIYLAFKGHDGIIPTKSTGYNGIRYMNAANFVNQELVHELDRNKVTYLLERISKSNQFGTGFAVFHSAQTATAECLFGRGDSALGYLNGVLRALDKSGTCLRECEDRDMCYFMTNSNAYILVPVFMLMQSCNGKIIPFPAVPSSWKNVAFYNLPAENGLKVSGKMENGKVKWVNYNSKNPK